MWQTLGPVALEVARQAARRRQKDAPALPVATLLERMGRSLELVSRLVRLDAETGGHPIVTRHDRELAAELLVSLLTNSAERREYAAFLEHIAARQPPWQPPDALTRAAIHQLHWAQLSSAFLAGLLLSREGIEATAGDLAATRPTAWEQLLPKPRTKSRPDALPKKKKP
jgi:hypothetical protein